MLGMANADPKYMAPQLSRIPFVKLIDNDSRYIINYLEKQGIWRNLPAVNTKPPDEYELKEGDQIY